ncbi:MAG TPA: immunoglobulin domain-containing protein [Opitutaceae bacterium]|nr:immunoglobulin domain-containing protein [Opitutaceae bacterium]
MNPLVRTFHPLAFSLAIAVAAPRAAASYNFQTLAGADIQPGYVNGTGTAARFHGPSGAAVDAQGNVYVADTQNNAIRMIAPGGVVTTIAGDAQGNAGFADGTGSSAQFNHPQALALDGQGRIYVADTGNESVRLIVVSGGVGTVSTVTDSEGSVQGIAVDAAGDTLYLAIGSLNSIHFLTLNNGVPTGDAVLAGDEIDPAGFADGAGGAAQFNNPTGLALGANVLYVADTGNSLIRAVTIGLGGGVVTTIAGEGGIGYGNIDGTGWTGEAAGTAAFNGPVGLVLDPGGSLYVADTGDGTIRMISFPGGGAAPQVTTAYGVPAGAASIDGPAGAARFDSPTGIARDGQGDFYVTDNATSLVRLISGGQVTTVAGASGEGWVDATGAAARFGGPQGTAVDAQGNIYVADGGNQVIRRITPQGVVTTLAGSPGVAGNQDGPGASALFSSPTGVAVDSAGDTVYVADLENHSIRKLAISGGAVVVSTLVHGFYVPYGVAVDAAGDVFFTDVYGEGVYEWSHGTVTTIAGGTFEAFGVDGTGSQAFFHDPIGIAASADGKTLYVADQGNYAIRKIVISGGVGTVTTAAGHLGVQAYGNGPAASSYCGAVWGVALDAQGNVYFTEPFFSLIRELDTTNTVSVVGGTLGVQGELDGVGTAAQFDLPLGIAVDASQNLYISDYSAFTVRAGLSGNVANTAPAISTQPLSLTVAAGANATFTVAATGVPAPSYQWQLNGAPLSGDTSPTLELMDVGPGDSGDYSVVVSNSQGSVTSSAAVLTVGTAPSLVLGPQNQTSVVGGSANFAVQATGLPSVAYQWSFDGAPIAGATGNTLDLSDLTSAEAGSYSVDVSNFVGSISAAAELTVDLPPAPVIGSSSPLVGTVGQDLAFTLQASNEPTSYQETGALPPGTHFGAADGSITGAPTSAGVFPVTLTAANAGGSATLHLSIVVNPVAVPVNFSVMAAAGGGGDALTVGFIVDGSGAERTLLRTIGPTLAEFGVAHPLPDPVLSLYGSNSSLIATNSAWGGGPVLAAAFSATGAFALPAASKDDALLETLSTGTYTCVATSTAGDSGVALVELYDADNAAPTAHLANLSGLARVGALGAALNAGVVIAGSQPKQILLRAVGPTLAEFGLGGVLAQPRLTLFDQSGLVIATNTGWGHAPAAGPSPVAADAMPATGAIMSAVGAFPLAPGSGDCAMVVTVPPGSYSVQVDGLNGSTGYALFEYYEL